VSQVARQPITAPPILIAPAWRLLAALCGVVGTLTLIGSFFINPAPPPNLTLAQLADWAIQHHTTLILGGWLQGVGSTLTVLFVLALAQMAGYMHRFAGWVALLSGAALVAVSLAEVSLYLTAAQAAVEGDAATGTVSTALIKGVQHVFLIVPAILLPTGIIILGSHVLPRGFGYAALLIGAVLQVLGLVNLFDVLQPVIDAGLILQGVWFLVAALTLAVRAVPAPVQPPLVSAAG